jgi:hypothetical protein
LAPEVFAVRFEDPTNARSHDFLVLSILNSSEPVEKSMVYGVAHSFFPGLVSLLPESSVKLIENGSSMLNNIPVWKQVFSHSGKFDNETVGLTDYVLWSTEGPKFTVWGEGADTESAAVMEKMIHSICFEK